MKRVAVARKPTRPGANEPIFRDTAHGDRHFAQNHDFFSFYFFIPQTKEVRLRWGSYLVCRPEGQDGPSWNSEVVAVVAWVPQGAPGYPVKKNSLLKLPRQEEITT